MLCQLGLQLATFGEHSHLHGQTVREL